MTREEQIRKAADEYELTKDFALIARRCFTAGAIWADKHPQSPWIKVKDKRPELQDETPVLENREKPKLYVVIPCKQERPLIATACNNDMAVWIDFGYHLTIIRDEDVYFPLPDLMAATNDLNRKQHDTNC